MRLVAENGDQLGIKTVVEALRLAEEANVDLVEIAPLAVPPVCKLMDYGKFRYREQKKAHEAKLKQKQIQVKEIKFRPGTDEGDYKIKLGKLIGRWRTRNSASGSCSVCRKISTQWGWWSSSRGWKVGRW